MHPGLSIKGGKTIARIECKRFVEEEATVRIQSLLFMSTDGLALIAMTDR